MRRTAERLANWGASQPLILAGLCHAAYGTAGFPAALIALSCRDQLVDVIGTEAEAIVYFYASCDRGMVLPQLGRRNPPKFRDRFTGVEFVPDSEMLRRFVELTFANELDIVLHSPHFAEANKADLAELFGRCREFATDAANAAADHILLQQP